VSRHLQLIGGGGGEAAHAVHVLQLQVVCHLTEKQHVVFIERHYSNILKKLLNKSRTETKTKTFALQAMLTLFMFLNNVKHGLEIISYILCKKVVENWVELLSHTVCNNMTLKYVR
jgi:hypothetical protein